MRASVVLALAASVAVLPSMSMPISSDSYDLYEREVPTEGSGALGFGLVKDVFKIGKHLIHPGSSNSNNNNKQKHRRELEELLSRRELIDLLTREMEEEMYARENGAVEGSGALGFGLIKDAFKIGKHIIHPGSSNSNNNNNQKKHRRDLDEADLWERDFPEEGLYERELPEEEFLARDLSEDELWERAVQEGSGALGFGLIKDAFKIGKHLVHPGSSNSNNNNNQKHRRSEFDDLSARDYEYTYQWE
ncbi:hypothetical protein FOMPIDRAFT_81933 [Fomitopsis schrenkii]|uniref:Uncharacterized protein n=1 Tax=Fomitopsis schrenkii TaxID=2126942 RepID=S8DX81_FOMSC|nr:hypothetical protein FOMPIDRAFT_81933 [Fomitopsis schrenkii]